MNYNESRITRSPTRFNQFPATYTPKQREAILRRRKRQRKARKANRKH